MRIRARVYHIAGRVGVCAFRRRGKMHVAECVVHKDGSVHVLPQSIRECLSVRPLSVNITTEPTDQDHVDRAAMGLERFRHRLSTFDVDWADSADLARWAEEAIAARDELVGLIIRLRAEKGVAW